MPYRSRNELPDNLKNKLPAHAQDIYMSAYNNAWEEYLNPEKRRSDDSREEVAHRVAWAAVKTKYRKSPSGKWVEK